MAENDDDDADTIFEANYMSNIAPQHHREFNGSGGLWFKLERFVQKDLVKDGNKEVWVFAGCIIGQGEHEKVGPDKEIWVPPMFFKIVIFKNPGTDEPSVLAFLLPHQRSSHGEIQDFLVTVDVIEALTGLNFFHEMVDQEEIRIEDQSMWESWKRMQG